MKHLRSDYDDSAALDARIPDDEPVFLLRGKDPSAPTAVRAWADDVERRGGDPKLVHRVRAWANDMGVYQQAFYDDGHTVADVPEGALR